MWGYVPHMNTLSETATTEGGRPNLDLTGRFHANRAGLDMLHQGLTWTDVDGGEHPIATLSLVERIEMVEALRSRSVDLEFRDAIAMLVGPFAPTDVESAELMGAALDVRSRDPWGWLERTEFVRALLDD